MDLVYDQAHLVLFFLYLHLPNHLWLLFAFFILKQFNLGPLILNIPIVFSRNIFYLLFCLGALFLRVIEVLSPFVQTHCQALIFLVIFKGIMYQTHWQLGHIDLWVYQFSDVLVGSTSLNGVLTNIVDFLSDCINSWETTFMPTCQVYTLVSLLIQLWLGITIKGYWIFPVLFLLFRQLLSLLDCWELSVRHWFYRRKIRKMLHIWLMSLVMLLIMLFDSFRIRHGEWSNIFKRELLCNQLLKTFNVLKIG